MNIYNSERYHDPTAYHASTNIQKDEKAARYRPLVYICSPYSGDTANNTEKAKKHCRFAVDNNAIPLAPHLLFPQFMNEEAERDLAMFMDLVLIGRCEQLWVFGDTVTEGMKAEISKANKKGIKIRRFTELYREYNSEEDV